MVFDLEDAKELARVPASSDTDAGIFDDDYWILRDGKFTFYDDDGKEVYTTGNKILREWDGKINSYENQYFVVYDEPAKSDVYRDLKQHEYEIEHFTDSEISGQVEVPEDKTLLFTTIPYDENWHVYVDGNEEAIRSVLNETFISVPMEEGRHKVVFEYRNPWKVRGMAGTTAGVLIILVLWILDRKKCMRKR